MADQGEEKKIIVDEDWKSQVEKEKETQKQQGQPAAEDDSQPQGTAGEGEGQPPPASIDVLVSSLATQAMFGLGQIPDPETGQPVLRPDFAKYHIDMLAVLEEKTQGNLTDEETKALSNVVHELRMAYVAITKGGGQGQ